MVKAHFKHVDVLAICRQAATACYPQIFAVFCDKEEQFFGDGTGTHKKFHDLDGLADSEAGLFLGFTADSFGRVAFLEQTGTCLNHWGWMVVDEGGIAKLAGEDDASFCLVIE